ncbi:MAG: ArsA family ATPase [Kofleriaceae bacterium]|nr:ArsA family ATPase [Myxococcales bacterium]MCB9573775.1 ArsA family ATPase [Kofleriaceae bacterium]
MSLFDKRLILVCGKGGVGRSTVAASIAAACARRGRKTLLFETMANDRFGDYFGKPAVGTEICNLAPNLSGVNTNPAAALEEYGLMILKFRTVYEMVFENRLVRAFIRAIPGIEDYAMLGKAWYHVMEQKRGKPVWDTIVFDLPASGHSVSMLRVPWVIVDTVPDGPLTRDAHSVQALLRDQARTAVVLTTLAEEMPANEARELSGKLDQLMGLKVAQLVVNQLYPDRFTEGTPQAKVLAALTGAGDLEPRLAALAAHGEMARSRRTLNERYLAQLAEQVAAPQIRLPLVFAPQLTPTHIEQLSQVIEAAA